MNALGAATLGILLATVVLAPRRWALLGAIAGILYLTQAQQLEIGGLNLYAVRFIELAAFTRVLARKEFSFSRMTRLDRALILLYAYTTAVFLMRSNEDQVYQIGIAVDAFLSYFAFRGLLADLDDYRWLLASLILLLAPYAVLVTYETLTSNNPFAAIGGVQLNLAGDRWFRDGRLRATGSFGHPSLMGTLGGTLLPLYFGMCLGRIYRSLAWVGVVLSLVLVWASNSGGPATCVAASALGWCLWPMREHMQWVRRGSVAFICLLALLMKAPIWYLLARVSDITGGDGYHRSALLDVAFQNLDKWWFAGMRLLDTSGWLPYTNTNTGAVDMTNNFLVFGITAGLGAMALLIWLLRHGFGHIGQALAQARQRHDESLEYVLWGVGVMLGVHLFNWFGITYWDQSNLLWFLHLATIGSLTAGTRDAVAAPAESVAREAASTVAVVRARAPRVRESAPHAQAVARRAHDFRDRTAPRSPLVTKVHSDASRLR